MLKCPSCGFQNPDSRERCLKCKTLLRSNSVPDGSHAADAPEPRVHPRIAARRALSVLGRKLQGRLPDGVPRRFPWTAAYLSLIPGAGQFYNYQPRKGFVFLLIWSALIGLAAWTWFDWVNNWILLGLVFWIFYAMADGFASAARINGDYFTTRNLLAVWFGLMSIICAVIFLGQLFGYGFFYMTTVKSSTMSPAIDRGDKLFILAWPFKNFLPGRGSVVYYDPPKLVYEKPGGLSSDIYTLNEQNGFGVITALEEESLSWEGSDILVNGDPVPPRALPLIPEGIPGSGSVEVPADHYGIFFTHGVEESGLLSFLGGSFGSAVPNPAEAATGGFIVKNYTETIPVPEEEIFGVVLFRYYPPPRREWFGISGGIHGED